MVEGRASDTSSAMAPRWIKTKEHGFSPFNANDEDDWLLMSGQFVAGRVFRETTGRNAGRFLWTLTGFHGLAAMKGQADSLQDGQCQLLARWRAWQAWAGVQDRND
jgi:hypothetical protein